MYLSLYCKGSKRVTQGFTVRGSRRPNRTGLYWPPTLIVVSVVSFSFSKAAQPEAQGPSSLLDDGFLYCILSPTGLHRGSRRPLRPGVAFPTTSCLRRLWSPTVWLPVLTESYNSSTPTQSPTQSLEWHVWLSSIGNNCHAVQRSLSSGASVYVCIMGFYLVPFHQPNPPTRFFSITGHWNVSLPFGASLWNGTFARAEGQYITIPWYLRPDAPFPWSTAALEVNMLQWGINLQVRIKVALRKLIVR